MNQPVRVVTMQLQLSEPVCLPGVSQHNFTSYAEFLIRLAAPRLSGVLKRKLDPEDVVQSALASFFRVYRDNKITVQNSKELWSLLVTITLRKCRYHLRYYLSAKRHINKERQLSENDSISRELCDEQPAPADILVLLDLIEGISSSLSVISRDIFALSLQNFTAEEIASKVGLSERSVYRQLERTKALLQSHYLADT